MQIKPIGAEVVEKFAPKTKAVLTAERTAKITEITASIIEDRKIIGSPLGSLVQNTIGKVAEVGANLAEGVQTKVAKIKTSLYEVITGVQAKNAERKTIQAEINALEAKQLKIKELYDAKIAASESYVAEVAKLDGIKARKASLQQQLQALDTAEKETALNVDNKLNQIAQFDKEI